MAIWPIGGSNFIDPSFVTATNGPNSVQHNPRTKWKVTRHATLKTDLEGIFQLPAENLLEKAGKKYPKFALFLKALGLKKSNT